MPAQKRARADSPSESSRSSLERYTTLNVLEPNRSETPEDEYDDDRQRSFGEKLRQSRDDEDDSGKSEDEPKLSLTEQEGKTHLLPFSINMMTDCEYDSNHGRRR